MMQYPIGDRRRPCGGRRARRAARKRTAVHLKLSIATINDVTYEYFKQIRPASRSARRKIRSTSIVQSTRPASRRGRGRGSRHDRGGRVRNGFWVSLEPRFAVLDAPACSMT